jgi:trans-aconitate methyltransferase
VSEEKGVIRDVDASVTMDLATAEAVIKWLQDKVATGRKLLEQLEKGEG